MEDLVLEEETELAERRVIILTLNRPDDRNPINAPTIAILRERLQSFAQEGLRGPGAIIVTGSGKAFSAGGDLKAYTRLFKDPPAFRTFMNDFNSVCDLLERIPAVTVAMINGDCVAGGTELALSCDVITIADTARIGDGHLQFSQMPGAGGSQRLLRAIGHQRAKYWLLSGKLFSAGQAVEAGLAIESFPHEDLRPRTLDLAADLICHSPLAIAEIKRLNRVALSTTLDAGLEIEAEAAYNYATKSLDAHEGLRAFIEKRPARFVGE